MASDYELSPYECIRLPDYKGYDFIGSHPVSVQLLTTSSAVAVATSVMSEMIGPEVTGESAENRLAAA